ncbi:uncharacterized protein LOC142608684 [Castanea sativa]|uniref:uncharacterized protein LOC142608684 n=1 Tax=Castanea sativa TaxID=21020 RepID=UPI003F653C74
MKLLAWNCRGFARPTTRKAFKGLLRTLNLACIFLSETKIPKHKITSLLSQFGFTNILYQNPVRKADGLCFAWKNGLDIEPISLNCNLINVLVFSDPPNSPWMLSLVYGPPYSSLKANFWQSLENSINSFGGAWIGIGDFNYILSQNEKLGGRPFALSSDGGFNGFINNNGLIDLGFQGNKYT